MPKQRLSTIADMPPADGSDDNRSLPRVLVVDDDPALQLVMSETLAEAGFDVAVASSGNEAIERCAEFEPELVLLDINMPGMDGITACGEIRRQSGRRFPIIMVTSVDDASSIQEAFDAGATDFILKPVNWPIFQRRLESVLTEWHRSAALVESKHRVDLLEKVAPERAMVVDRKGNVLEDLKQHRAPLVAVGDGHEQTLAEIFGDETAGRFRQIISGVLKTGRDNRLEFTMDEQGIANTLEAEFLAHGRDSVLLIVQHISSESDRDSEVYELAFYDRTSNLPNRHLLEKVITENLANAGLHDESVGVVCVGIDGFTDDELENKDLMSSLGGRINACLQEYTGGLTVGKIENEKLVARVAQDNLMFFVQDVHAEKDVAGICEYLDGELDQAADSEQETTTPGLHFGIATYPVDGRDFDSLQHAAESASREARVTGDTVCLASAASTAYAIDTTDYGNELRQAIRNDQLELYFQPRIALPDDTVTCFEALLRWNHPIRGFVGLEELLPLAKSTGLIVDLGDWVLRNACQQAKTWEADPVPRVSVNLSQQEFSRQDFAERVIETISRAGIEPGQVELEFTEAALLRTRNELADLEVLHKLGIGLVLDNFGTGHSSLTLLSQYPIHAMKIDGAFVRTLPGDDKDSAVCDVIVSMAHKFGMKAVAESVETAEQLELLMAMGCDEFQGYHICEPLPALDVELYLRRRENPKPTPAAPTGSSE